MKEVYQSQEDGGAVGDTLEDMVREGVRRMLAAALDEEVNRFLGRERGSRTASWPNFRQVSRLPGPPDQAISWKGLSTTIDTSSSTSPVPSHQPSRAGPSEPSVNTPDARVRCICCYP